MQPFWATRFVGNGTRSYLFEAKEQEGEMNWGSLFKITVSHKFSMEMINRKRIWKVLQELADLVTDLVLAADIPLKFTAANDVIPQCPNKVSCELWPREQFGQLSNGDEGAYLLGHQSTTIPRDIEDIKVFYTILGGKRLLVGLAFMPTSGHPVRIGMSSPNYCVIQVRSRPLTGFVLGVAARGFKALEAYTTGNIKMGGMSDSASPKTHRLMGQARIVRIVVGIDVSKVSSDAY